MKKILVLLSVVIAAATSQAAYLYWQVDAQNFNGQDIGAAYLHAIGEEDKPVLSSNIVGEGYSIADIGSYVNFYVEFLNYDNESIAVSDNMSYEGLTTCITANKLTDVPMAQIWHAEAAAVPEPTSGLLMLMGVAFLGLKRRKA